MQTKFKIAPFIGFLFLSLVVFSACQDSKPSKADVVGDKEPKDNTSVELPLAKKETTKNYDLPDWPIAAEQKNGKIHPFDEGKKDPRFAKFRQRLYNAVKEKDLNFLLPVISDSIFFSFGGYGGKSAFVEFWQLDSNPDKSGMWKELAICLELGGKFDNYDGKIRFAAPYVYMVEDFVDPFGEGVIIGDNVRLRDAPGLKSKIIGSLSWDHFHYIRQDEIVQETINGETNPWIQLKTLNGEQGYVYGKYTRFPVDYRVGFTKDNKDNWSMEFFIAGD